MERVICHKHGAVRRTSESDAAQHPNTPGFLIATRCLASPCPIEDDEILETCKCVATLFPMFPCLRQDWLRWLRCTGSA